MCALLILSCILSSWTHIGSNYTQTSGSEYNEEPVIVIDAGHGGEDGGAVSESGLIEKNVNLSIALKLQKFFTQSGFKVKMIRTDDYAVYSDDASTLRDKKVSDIHNRAKLCNDNPNNILISIHQNKFEQSKYKGTQVFYSGNNSLSNPLAECIRTSVKGLLQHDNNRLCKLTDDSVYILKNATVPAVLVECGFLSNPQEAELLSTLEYQNRMAFSIYSGFIEFYYQYYE